jgi:hypothetical protein
MIKNGSAGTGGVVEFLRFLSNRMCANERSLEFMACLTAADRVGKTFILDIANFMGAPVTAYDSYYGPGPHGNEWLATPGAQYPDLIWNHPSYDGSAAQLLGQPNRWFSYYGGLLNYYHRLGFD